MRALLNVPDPDKLDISAFSQGLVANPQSVDGILTQWKTNSNTRAELKKLGYIDEQIPDWIAEAAIPALAALAAIAALAALLNPPVHTGRARKIEAAQLGQLS